MVLTMTYASVAVKASSTLTGELVSLSSPAHGVGVTAVPPSETWVLLRLPPWDNVVLFTGTASTLVTFLKAVRGQDILHREGSTERKQEDKNNVCDLTVDVPNLVAHGEADELIISVVQNKDLVHAQHLGGFDIS